MLPWDTVKCLPVVPVLGDIEGADICGDHPLLGGRGGLGAAEEQPVLVRTPQDRPER